MDWGSRLIEAGKRPENSVYREWIELHGPDVLGDLVAWMSEYLDGASLPDRSRTETIFRTALRYEYLFWEAAYNGESWPGEGLGARGWGLGDREKGAGVRCWGLGKNGRRARE